MGHEQQVVEHSSSIWQMIGMGIGGFFTVIVPLFFKGIREWLGERILKRFLGDRKEKVRFLPQKDFDAFIVRNDHQHEEVKHLLREAVSEFGHARQENSETRTNVARVEGKVDTILQLMPRQ